MDAIDLVANILTALAGVTLAVVAGLGLGTWRRKLKGEHEHALARRLLRCAFRIRDDIARVRNPFLGAGEIGQAFQEAGLEPNHEAFKLDERTDEVVYQRRWDRLRESLSALDVEIIEGEALWGRDVRTSFEPLYACASELFAAVLHHLESQKDTDARLPAEETKEMKAKLYMRSRDPKKDSFTAQVDDAVTVVEDAVRPHLVG